MSTAAFVIALLGAESTGKSTLAQALTETLRSRGVQATLVGEYLREFCEARGRTPTLAEQRHIADEQTRRIQAAGATAAVVVADTTALMTAVYNETVFDDRSLYPLVMGAQPADLHLLMALDLPWLADGIQRDGPHVRGPVDGLLRATLNRAGWAYNVVSGQGRARLQNALRSVSHAMRWPSEPDSDSERLVRWRGWCERCSDPECERFCLALA